MTLCKSRCILDQDRSSKYIEISIIEIIIYPQNFRKVTIDEISKLTIFLMFQMDKRVKNQFHQRSHKKISVIFHTTTFTVEFINKKDYKDTKYIRFLIDEINLFDSICSLSKVLLIVKYIFLPIAID